MDEQQMYAQLVANAEHQLRQTRLAVFEIQPTGGGVRREDIEAVFRQVIQEAAYRMDRIIAGWQWVYEADDVTGFMGYLSEYDS